MVSCNTGTHLVVQWSGEQTLYAWRNHFGEMQPADVKRLKTFEAENAKLKRLLAERVLEVDLLKEVNR